MAAKTSKSGLASRLGQEAQKAWQEHKDDAISADTGASLPPGIEDGVAKVVDCYISQYHKGDLKGKDYFMMAAVVVSPESFTDAKGTTHNIAGRRISRGPIPICQSKDWEGKPVSVADNYNEMMDALKRLGVGVTDPEVLSPENIEATCEAVKGAEIHTGFRTWGGEKTERNKNAKVYVNWLRAVSFNGEATDAVVDDSAAAASDSSESSDDSGSTTEATDNSTVDIDELVSACDANDADSQRKLKDMALEAGVTEEQIDDAQNWREVADLLNEKTSGGSDDAKPADDWTPKADMVVRYKPIDGKTGKPRAKAINVEIKSVNTKNKTVKLLNLVDKKTEYDKVAWIDLEHD